MEYPSKQDFKDWQNIQYILQRISSIDNGNFEGLENMLISINNIQSDNQLRMQNIKQLVKLSNSQLDFFDIIRKTASFALMLPKQIKPQKLLIRNHSNQIKITKFEGFVLLSNIFLGSIPLKKYL